MYLMFSVVWFVVLFFIVFLKYVEVELFNIILFVLTVSQKDAGRNF